MVTKVEVFLPHSNLDGYKMAGLDEEISLTILQLVRLSRFPTLVFHVTGRRIDTYLPYAYPPSQTSNTVPAKMSIQRDILSKFLIVVLLAAVASGQ